MTFYTQYCNKCGKKIGRFEERFRDSMLEAKCGTCKTILEIREIQ